MNAVMAWSDEESDGVLVHYCSVVDEDDEPIGKLIICNTRDEAIEFGQKWAKSVGLAFLNETLS